VEVHIATTDDDGPGRRLAQPPQADGPHGQYHHFPKRTEFYKVAPALGRWLNRHVADYDLVHIHALFSYTSIAAGRAARKAGVPYIVRPLGTLTRYGIEQRRPWLKKLSLRFFEAPLLRHAAAVHFTAVAERDEALTLGVEMQSAVVPLAVEPEDLADVEGFESRFPALRGGGYVLFLSRIDPKKNVEALLDAVALLAVSHPGLMLALVGDGKADYLSQLKARAAALGLTNRVVWTGFLYGGLKAAALQRAAVFALPSFSENFGIAAAEALLAGLPCVLGQGVAIAKEVQDAGAGMAVEPTAQATAQALLHYLESAQVRSAAGVAAAKFAQRHLSLEAMSSGLLTLYQTVLSRPGVGGRGIGL